MRQAAVLDAGGRIIQETRHFHEDTGTPPPGGSKERPRTTGTSPSPTWCRSPRPRRLGGADPRPRCPSCRRAPGPAAGRVGPVRAGHAAALANAGAVDLVGRDRRGGRLAGRRAQVVAGRAGPARQRGRRRAGRARRSPRPRSPGSADLVAAGTLNDKLARQVLDGVLTGEGDPDEVMAARGLAVVSDDRRADRGRRRGDRGQPGRRRQGPRRQGGRGRRAGRRGHEGHPRPGRRRPRPRADPAAPDLAPRTKRHETRDSVRSNVLNPGFHAPGRAERRQAPGPGNSGRRSWRDRSDQEFRTERAGPGASAPAARVTRTATRAAISSAVASPRTTRSSGCPGGRSSPAARGMISRGTCRC